MEEIGWLKGLRDPGVARALAAIHDACGEEWIIEALAHKARAAFAERLPAPGGQWRPSFTDALMQYLQAPIAH